MPKCSFNNCKNNTSKTLKRNGISYFRFPRDPIRCGEWTSIVSKQRCEDCFMPNKSSVVCSEHFFDNDMYVTEKGLKRLVNTANPRVAVNDRGESTSDTNESQVEGHASTSKSTRLIPLRRSAEDIIVSVYNYLQAEYEQLKSSIGTSCDLSPLANILQRTAAATGVSEQAVSYILEEKERADDDELVMNASDAKRAKLTQDHRDGNVSPITDDESSCEPDEEHDDITEQDNELTCDESEEPVETLKVEIKEEEETQSAVQYILRTSAPPIPRTNTYSVHVSKPPAVLVYPQSSTGVLRVISIEPMSSLTTVKTEPDDDPPDSDTTASDVKLEPPS